MCWAHTCVSVKTANKNTASWCFPRLHQPPSWLRLNFQPPHSLYGNLGEDTSISLLPPTAQKPPWLNLAGSQTMHWCPNDNSRGSGKIYLEPYLHQNKFQVDHRQVMKQEYTRRNHERRSLNKPRMGKHFLNATWNVLKVKEFDKSNYFKNISIWGVGEMRLTGLTAVAVLAECLGWLKWYILGCVHFTTIFICKYIHTHTHILERGRN